MDATTILAFAGIVTALMAHGAVIYLKLGKLEQAYKNHSKALNKLTSRCPLCIADPPGEDPEDDR